MSTALFTPEPLFVHDETLIKNGCQVGTFDIKTNDRKWIADVKPYGGSFPDYKEAKAYAKLFAASPDMIAELKTSHEFLLQLHNAFNSKSGLDFNAIQQDLRDRMTKQLAIIDKALT